MLYAYAMILSMKTTALDITHTHIYIRDYSWFHGGTRRFIFNFVYVKCLITQ